MSREIKFRIWDNLKNEWVTNKYIWRMKTDVNGIGEIHPHIFYWKQHPHGLTYQQYTGLKDKNGVEIYEGDIVRGVFFDTDYMGDIVVTCPVNWVADSACFNVGHRYWTRSSLKVIGNIFENPELLNHES